MSKNWWLFIGLVVLISAALGHNLLLLIALLLALIGSASYLWARYCLTGVTYQRSFSATRLFHGDEAEVAVQVINAKPMPLAWLITIDEFPADVQLMTKGLFVSPRARRRLLVNTFSLRWYEKVTRRYRIRGLRRGVWRFGPVQLSSGDIFGFSIKRDSLEETQSIVVYPKIVPLTSLRLPDLHPFGDFRTPRRIIDDPLRLMGAREYVSGDSFRHIHWKASAHGRDLQTKVFEPSANRPLALFLNARTAEFANEGIDREILELAVTAAASIACWSWQEGHPTGLYTNSVIRSSRERVRIPPANQPEQLIEILGALASMENDGLWTISTILELESTALSYGVTVVVVTSLLSDRLLKALINLRRHEHGVTLVALGNARLDRELPGVRYYHIGGREVWHDLEALELA
jgi:uncharacterized protein (DUF58 family)